MNGLRVYDYLVLARERVMESLRQLTREQYGRSFPIGLKSISATITHIMISEWYYIERLEGRQVAPYEQWPIQYESPPPFAVVESTWHEQAKNTRASLEAQRDWNRSITYESFPDEVGKRYLITATAGDFFAQLALHEVHHRAQIMVMLREFRDSIPPLEDIDYNALMFQRIEIPR